MSVSCKYTAQYRLLNNLKGEFIMCGIIGVVANENIDVSSRLMDGLKRVEYRGYDSSGIATVASDGSILCVRSTGNLNFLKKKLYDNPINGNIGIGHTRWATHGVVTENNAHPHVTDKVAVVHNGIIENFQHLRKEILRSGRIMKSETDSEVIAHLITQNLEKGLTPVKSVEAAIKKLSGTYALAVIFSGKKSLMVAAKQGSPLAIGYANKSIYVGSDAISLSPFTSKVSYLKDGDIANIEDHVVTIYDNDNKIVNRSTSISGYSQETTEKGIHRHYMMKEILEQPSVLSGIFSKYINEAGNEIIMPEFPFNFADVPQITIVACGTSNYAGMISRYWIEKLSGLNVSVDIASEFRYRETPLKAGGVALFISQSGETADTLAALKFAKEKQQFIISVVNVTQSTMANESDVVLPIFAGAEIGVASTKAFTAQLTVMACLAIYIASARGVLKKNRLIEMIKALKELPHAVEQTLMNDRLIYFLAQSIFSAKSVLFIGRGTSYPVAMEGALKLKELTYIHAEGIAAGELKHGPLALVDKDIPIIAINPSDNLFGKTCSNIYEAIARKGNVIALCDSKGALQIHNITPNVIIMPDCHEFATPVIYTVALQMLAYYVAVAKGNDVDQPRNLAKSVTVE